MTEKTFPVSGADELTPSRSEYFSWINNTNEGSTERQTLINLAFFEYLKKQFGMTLDIYSLDAGNLDGAGNSYESETSEKISAQFPEGYKNIADAAKKIGTRLGIWGGADGYGDSTEDAEKRRKTLVNLCEKYRFFQFKFDAVCGSLRKEKIPEFIKTMQLCRKACPDLILLNHRNDLGDGARYATTFLWEGMETYVDVHAYNCVTAPHNRAYMFFRGHTPEMKRLTEDHGVCLSSSLDYFADDLIYQAFNRCLILAPEIYGNPWFLKDEELGELAEIFNLHRKYRDILVNGIALGSQYGNNAVSRGDGKHLFIATGNASWQQFTAHVKLNEEIGLKPCDKIAVITRFPLTETIGVYSFGEVADVKIDAFRACLIEICPPDSAEAMPVGCALRITKRLSGAPACAEVVHSFGKETCLSYGRSVLSANINVDALKRNPVLMGKASDCPVPENAERIYETQCFAADNDSLEKRCSDRAGETHIPEVKAARNAFFSQKSYLLRGIDCQSPFNKNNVYPFDTKSRTYVNFDGRKGFRVENGCLRVDFGVLEKADRVEIVYFEGKDNDQFAPQTICDFAEVSDDLGSWTTSLSVKNQTLSPAKQEFMYFYCDTFATCDGERKKVTYYFDPEKPFSKFRLDCPPDRIYTITRYLGDRELTPINPKLTNLFAPYNKKTAKSAADLSFKLPEVLPEKPYLSIAVDGVTGNENVFCGVYKNGKLYGCPSRANAYPSNCYEYPVHPSNKPNGHNAYFEDSWFVKATEPSLYQSYSRYESLAVFP